MSSRMKEWGVYSEVGHLHTVMVHQPGWEHRRMLPWNMEAMLFDDIIDIDFARPEHKMFVNKMSTQGVRVLYFADMLKDVCSDPVQHKELVREVVGKSALGNLDPMRIQPSHLIIGYPGVYRFDTTTLLEPLPNLYFMRDPAFFIQDHLIISHFYYPIRQRESLLAKAVFSRHPLFEGVKIYDGIYNDPEATIEGGDVLVPDSETVLVGISERTNEKGAEHLARYLFENTSIKRLIKIFIPQRHEFMHLDTLFTFIDRQQIITMPLFWDSPEYYTEITREVHRQCGRLGTKCHAPHPEHLSSGCYMKVLTPDKEERQYNNVMAGLDELGVIVPDITVTVAGQRSAYNTPEEHIQEALREQWNDAANTFALKPGTVMSYSRNGMTIRAMEDRMVEVLQFDGGELVRGRGGPRCMTMPLKREPI